MNQDEQLQYNQIIQDFESLLNNKIDDKSIQKIKQTAAVFLENGKELELQNFLDSKFINTNVSVYKPHLLSVISSIYSSISLNRGLEFVLKVFKEIKPIPNWAISDLLRNCRKLSNYDSADKVFAGQKNLFNQAEITILYEAIFYFESKGNILEIKRILNLIEKSFKSSKPIMNTLLDLYIKYGTKDDVNRIQFLISKFQNDKLFSRPAALSDQNNRTEAEVDLKEFTVNSILEKMQLYEQKAKQGILSEMVNGISHEFGQPITNIKYQIQYYQKVLPNNVTKDEVLRIFSSILDDIDRLSHLVKTIAPITSSKSTAMYFNITQRIKNRFELSSSRLVENKIMYKINSADSSLLLFQDPIKFDQIINNLLLNAIDSLSEKNIADRWIEVKIRLLNARVCIDFKDNGIGVPDNKRKNIFIPFYTTKKEGKGEGLGLYIVWNLLKMMDGIIDLDYSYNDGACFKIEIPLRQEGETK